MNPSDLQIGVAAVEIIPPEPRLVKPTGMPRLGPTRGVLDAPRVEAMAVAAGGESAFVTTSDLRLIPEDWVERIRDGVAARTGCDPQRVLLSAVHNHSFSPQPADDSPKAEAACEAVNEMIIAGFIDACGRAADDLAPAEVAATTAHLGATVGECRRVRLSNGTCVTGWGSHPIVPPGLKIATPGGPNPTTAGVFAARRPGEAKPFVVLLDYDSHPHLYGIPYFSGEFPGGVKRRIEREIDGATCLFAHGTGGNVDLHCVHPMPDGVDEQVKWFRTSVQTLAERMAAAVVPAIPADGYRRPSRLGHLYRSTEAQAVDHSRRMVILNLLVVGEAAFVSMPGELFLEFGVAIRERSPFATTFLMGYNGSRQGYVGPPIAYEQGSYETMRGPSFTVEEEDVRRITVRARVGTGDEIVADILDGLAALHA